MKKVIDRSMSSYVIGKDRVIYGWVLGNNFFCNVNFLGDSKNSNLDVRCMSIDGFNRGFDYEFDKKGNIKKKWLVLFK